jgi:hypothetical protein
MVKGLDIFRERFHPFEKAFVVIGGAACDQWFTDQGLTFRATRDLDIVLVGEAFDNEFVTAMRSFVEEGGYHIRERSDGSPILYRFFKPVDATFPFMLELFSASLGEIDLTGGQKIIPVKAGPSHHSLSAILLDRHYGSLIKSHYDLRHGLRFANATALIPLKARAWIDLTAHRDKGGKVDSKDIDKHRADVFRLAATLPEEPGPELPITILADLQRFLDAFPDDSEEWPRILTSLKFTLGSGLRPAVLRDAIQVFFHLSIVK